MTGTTEGSAESVTVVLPHQLRERAGGIRTVAVRPGSVRDVITALGSQYPGITFSICHETGELRPFVNVFVGPENIRYLQGLETPVASGETVHIIHSVAGG